MREPMTMHCRHENGIVYHTAVSDYLELLALLLQFPTPELEVGLSSETIGEDFRTISREAGYGGADVSEASESLQRAIGDAKGIPEFTGIARREYTRLFNHPERPVIWLYEGAFLDTEKLREGEKGAGTRLFINPAALDAERCYRNAGLRKNPSINIPADCITTEIEFLSCLFARMANAIANNDEDLREATAYSLEEFVRIHVDKWFYRFFSRCVEESRCSLYTAVGMIGCLLFDPVFETRKTPRTS